MTLLSSSVQVPTGAAVNNRLQVSQLVGTVKQVNRTEFDQLVSDERSRIGAASGLYRSGEEIKIDGEVGSAFWTIATGGSASANASASHARNRTLPGGRTITLVNDSNSVKATSSAPSGGSDGDVLVDTLLQIYYTKVSGVWGRPVSYSKSKGVPQAFTTRTLSKDDDETMNIVTVDATVTVPNNMVSGFGCSFQGSGNVSFAGSNVVEGRTAGASAPFLCCLLQIGADSYMVVGSKA